VKLLEFYNSSKVVLSLEIFPPKQNYPLESVFTTLDGLQKLNPHFISVTYGAGGSTLGRTVEIAARIKSEYNIEPLAHLTCARHTRDEVTTILKKLWDLNIHNILALRGDPPADDLDFDFTRQEYRYAYELIKDAKATADFGIAAAAYPEGHIECRRISEDLRNLKQKVDAGVDFLITQLFFNNLVFYDFVEKAHNIGISCPIIPGIMPVLNASQIIRMASLCGASIPAKLLIMVDKYQHNPVDMEKAGIDYASEQIIDLIENKVPGIHLMTMNKTSQTAQIVANVSLG